MFTISISFALAVALSQKAGLVEAASCWPNTTCTGPSTAAFPGPWDEYNFSPDSRTVTPARLLSSDLGFVATYPTTATLTGSGSQYIYDFGQEVGGIVTVEYTSTGTGSFGLAFSEASNFTGDNSDGSNGSFLPDGALNATVTATEAGSYTMPLARLRGGFRYLTVFSGSTNDKNLSIVIQNVTLEISYQPSWSNLQAYQGYFSCSDELLTKIWYSGAFTLQTTSVPPMTGRAWPILDGGWENAQDLSLGTGVEHEYVDGAKRDRTVWPGDLGIAVPSILVSTGDYEGVANTLTVLYADQESSGQLPFAGPGINIYDSDTYHMATMIGTYDYFLWTDDTAWLTTIYPKYKLAMTFITALIDDTGMMDVTGTNDWGRLYQGGHNTEANMLLYKVLTSGSQLATWANDSASSTTWTGLAATLKAAVNADNWDEAALAFKNNDTSTTLYPEDGNSMALVFGGALESRVQNISESLTKNWISIGAVAPELPGNLVGFVQSFEIKGHLAAHQSVRALDLIRRAWGWYINNPNGTMSTTIEGYLSDGSFGYRSLYGYDNDYSYTSHSHGWGTGPTDALTSYIVGLTVTAPGGSEWQLAPQFGDLTTAEAGFTTPKGQFSAKWTLDGTVGYDVSWTVPTGTNGTLVLPASVDAGQEKEPSVTVDGAKVVLTDGGNYNGTTGTITLVGASGSHNATVSY